MLPESKIITVMATVNAPIEKVWRLWTEPHHIMQWNNASPDWHTPSASNDLQIGGTFSFRMEAKDSSFGFDFGGVYDNIKKYEFIAYTTVDGRKVQIRFTSNGNETRVVEIFEAESENPIEIQRDGWQHILESFKKYSESN